MRTWNGWTHAQRAASSRKTRKAKEAGIIPWPNELGCNRCGQKKGVIDYHNHDYSDSLAYLEPLCYRCHMILHCEYRALEICAAYWDEVAQGKQYPPVFTRNFGVMKRDHGL